MGAASFCMPWDKAWAQKIQRTAGRVALKISELEDPKSMDWDSWKNDQFN